MTSPRERSDYSAMRDREPMRLILDRVAVGVGEHTDQQQPGSVTPGSITYVDKNRLCVATGSSDLELLRVQPAGKRMMEIADFLRGNRLEVGDRLSSHTGPTES